MSRVAIRVTAAASLVLWAVGCSLQPSDDHLIRVVREKRPELEQLVSMMEQDEPVRGIVRGRFDIDESHPHFAPLRDARKDECLALLERLGVSGGVRRAADPACSYQLSYYSVGMLFSVNLKGIAYCPETPADLLPTLERGFELEPDRYYFRHVSGPWYLFHYHD